MTSPTLLSLADRVEQLTGPCRETADEVLLACGWQIEDWGEGPARSRGWINPAAGGEDYLDGDHPNPTASLDAAMTLVPEGLPILIRDGYDDAPGDKRPYAHVMNEIGEGYAATKALAIVVAALRARAALEVSRA